MKKYGIKETDEALTTAIGLIKAGVQAKKVGGPFLQNFGLFIQPLVTLPVAIEGADKVPREVTDIDEEEARFLIDKHGAELKDEDFKEFFFYFSNAVRKAKDMIDKRAAAAADSQPG